MEFGQKKFMNEIDLFDFTSFFWPGFFKIFWPTVKVFEPNKKNREISYEFYIFSEAKKMAEEQMNKMKKLLPF